MYIIIYCNFIACVQSCTYKYISYHLHHCVSTADVCKVPPVPCNQKCEVVNNSPLCSCYQGFRLDGVTCRVVSGEWTDNIIKDFFGLVTHSLTHSLTRYCFTNFINRLYKKVEGVFAISCLTRANWNQITQRLHFLFVN